MPLNPGLRRQMQAGSAFKASLVYIGGSRRVYRERLCLEKSITGVLPFLIT